MVKIEVKLIEENGRYCIIDRQGNDYSNCARKADAKKVLKKNEDLELVEEFSEIKTTTVTKGYEKYKEWILKNVEESDQHSKSSKLKEFADHFGVTYYEQYNRCRVFENTVKHMKAEEL